MRQRYLALLLPLFLAPACAQKEAPSAPEPGRKSVILSKSSRVGQVVRLRETLEARGDRVLLSGEADETAVSLAARLPWLLQPGVDEFYYDPGLAGEAGADSLRAVLRRLNHPATLTVLPLPSTE